MREAARARGDDPDELPHRYADVHQPRRRAEARRHDARRAPVPRQLQEHVGGRRAATSRWPRRCSTRWTSTATSSSTTTRARATSRRCASCPRARPSCSAWSPPSSASSSPRTTSSAASTRPRSTCRSSSSCLSPQCGFSSTVHGNDIAVEAQRAKLRLVVEVADEVWGGALGRAHATALAAKRCRRDRAAIAARAEPPWRDCASDVEAESRRSRRGLNSRGGTLRLRAVSRVAADLGAQRGRRQHGGADGLSDAAGDRITGPMATRRVVEPIRAPAQHCRAQGTDPVTQLRAELSAFASCRRPRRRCARADEAGSSASADARQAARSRIGTTKSQAKRLRSSRPRPART